MSTFKSFAIIGSGLVGGQIAKALIKKNVKLIILSRSPAKPVPEGAKAIQVSYTDVSALSTVLRENEVDVLISTVSGSAIESQYPIVDAAVEAGVQLFVPSEFGMPTVGNVGERIGRKTEVSSYSKGKGLPYTLFYTGYFLEFIDWLAGFQQTGQIYILGKGDVPCSWTDLEDIGGFVAHVLTQLPKAELENRIFRIEGSKATLLEAIRARHPEKPVEYVDSFPESIAYLDFFQGSLRDGKASSAWDPVTGKELPEGTWKDNRIWAMLVYSKVVMLGVEYVTTEDNDSRRSNEVAEPLRKEYAMQAVDCCGENEGDGRKPEASQQEVRPRDVTSDITIP